VDFELFPCALLAGLALARVFLVIVVVVVAAVVAEVALVPMLVTLVPVEGQVVVYACGRAPKAGLAAVALLRGACLMRYTANVSDVPQKRSGSMWVSPRQVWPQPRSATSPKCGGSGCCSMHMQSPWSCMAMRSCPWHLSPQSLVEDPS
jgi:hypothetical protein